MSEIKKPNTMNKEKDIRWEQRFMNYKKALDLLSEGQDMENLSKL